ncbi:nucleotidyltransferase [Stomatobaculum longum]|uniref:nucleotidyltransferase family protein n=1 Tax=Stomatobaculum longum TaxID=796942 RepID=UPI0028039F6F|nr:nucleotidyltransferase [Stomatobaculum longum]
MKTTLVVLAAGIGSRFGGGIKQLTPMGPNGEIIMDYAIYDAKRAGFDKVVFIIRKDLEQDFKSIIGDRIAKVIETDYAFQEIDDLPAGFSVPEGRKKPWGTGQALLSVRGKVNEPFVVINADDYYGPEGFRAVHKYMTEEMDLTGEKLDMCMAGFILKNTLSDNGTVTRGVCEVDERHMLKSVRETFEIRMTEEGLQAKDGAGNPVSLTPEQYVSMNMWGLPPQFLDVLAEGFPTFLKAHGTELKSEYLLPSIVDSCIQSGRGSVKVLPTHDKWFGVTYQEDKPTVVAAIRALIESGRYPEKLYD